ncbi:hypothetical protein [Streptococcus minor]|uniref:hypothetical protein n=1 Tax=Streptococcus minor TaxID=229549 RepID=UPI00035C0F86|nr:hypothetical protein [Streptococcus minor]MDO5078528.1 hypothetical protein [Streptococcus minor]
MKDFFKDNKFFAVYLMGSLISIFSLFRAGQLVLGLSILLYGARFYLRWKADRK